MRIKKILLATLLIVSPLILFATDYYIATSDLKVRIGAGTEYPVSFILQKGNEVEVLSKNGSWYKIKYLGSVGYAHSKYLKENRTISDTKENRTISDTKENSTIYDSEELIFAMILLGVIGFIWLVPILIVISSSKTASSEKIAWVLAVIFISWFAWIFYMLLAPIKKKD